MESFRSRGFEERAAEARRREVDRQTSDLPLLSGSGPTDWPERPKVDGAEQRGLPLPETPEALFAAWRAKPESDEVMAVLRRLALEAHRKGASAIGPRWLWEAARAELKRSVDNRLQALACREIEDSTPELRGLFRHRRRPAA